MDRRNGIFGRLADEMDLPGEVMPGQPLVELCGDKSVLIENHRGVTEYRKERIGIRVGYGQVLICGSGLELVRMSKEQLIVRGRIDSVSLCRR